MGIEDWFGKEAGEITEDDKVAWKEFGNLVEINMARLLVDVSDKAGLPVFSESDSDYDGNFDSVAVVDNECYATYLELAKAYCLDLSDYWH